MRGLFIIGNKRSGSSHLMRLLNLHPEIYVSKESDILWILKQHREGNHFSTYPWDSPKGMLNTLEQAGHLLNRDRDVREHLIAVLQYLMRRGFLSLAPMDKDDLKYIGDQKPYQNADPELVSLLLNHLPDSRFIHLYRHPFKVVRSAQRFHHGTGGYIWGALSAEEILEEWTIHEERVQELRDRFEIDVLDVDYSDLIAWTEWTMKDIFRFLDLDYDADLLWSCRMATRPNFRRIENYPVKSEKTRSIMENWGFQLRFNYIQRRIWPRIRRRALIIYIRLRAMLRRGNTKDPGEL